MPARCRLVSPLLAVAMVLSLAGWGAAQSYRDDQHHFTVELPTGWQVMPKSEIDQVNTLLGGRMIGHNIHYDAGLRKKTGRLGSFPYVLIQTVSGPPRGASFEEIEKSLSIDMKMPVKEVQGRLGDLVGDVKIGQPVLNRESKCIVLKTQSTVPGIGEVKGFSIGHLGKDSMVFIHGYAKGVDYDASMPTFRRINDWFSFDKGYDFKPGSGSSAFSFGGGGRGAIVGGAIGLLVGVCSYFFRLMSQSGRTKTTTSVDENAQEYDSYLNQPSAE